MQPATGLVTVLRQVERIKLGKRLVLGHGYTDLMIGG